MAGANGNGFRVREVPRPEMRERRNHSDLYRDILLRLEQTGPTKALCYEMENAEICESARNAILDRLRRANMIGQIELSRRGPNLYVARGPRWQKPDR